MEITRYDALSHTFFWYLSILEERWMCLLEGRKVHHQNSSPFSKPISYSVY